MLTGYYDYLHTRIMFGSFKSHKDVIKRSLTYCKEGAWLESQEVDMQHYSSDGSMPQERKVKEWCKLLIHASKVAREVSTL